MTDPISDMLARIRNAVGSRHSKVDVPLSKVKVQIARILKLEGYIGGFDVVEAKPHSVIRIQLKYGPRGERVITGLERVSRPGRRVYCGRHDVPRPLGGLGTAIMTTPLGVMTGREAVKQGVGGEVLCNIW